MRRIRLKVFKVGIKLSVLIVICPILFTVYYLSLFVYSFPLMADMSGDGYSLRLAYDSAGWWHTRDITPKGAWVVGSLGELSSSEMSSGIYNLSGGFAQFDPQKYVYQSKISMGEPARTGANAFGFNEDALWEWQVPVRGGLPLTITAYIRYNTEYGGSATKPKLTLYGKGISPTSVSATGAAENAWELLTINAGTPSQDAMLKLKAEGFSTNPGARFYIDDIKVNQ